MPKPLSKLEDLIDFTFKDIRLLERALTHRSWANERSPDTGEIAEGRLQNERLEFVGDSVLGLAIAEHLYQTNPDLSEGDLTLMKHHLVSAETLAQIAAKLDLGQFVKVGKGEEKTGGRKKQAILSDTLEAVFAAVFFDSGYIGARKVIVNLLREEIAGVTPKSSLDYKTLLQETLQGEGRDAPNYEVIKTDGPPHNRVFTVAAEWDGGQTQGIGNTIKAAEMEAASKAVEILEEEIEKQSPNT